MHVINFSFTPPSLSQQQQQQQPAQLQFCAELLFFFSMLALRVKICPRGPLSLAFHKKGEFASIFWQTTGGGGGGGGCSVIIIMKMLLGRGIITEEGVLSRKYECKHTLEWMCWLLRMCMHVCVERPDYINTCICSSSVHLGGARIFANREKSSSAIFRVKNKHQTGMLWCCFVSSLDSLLHLQMAVLNVRQPRGTGFQNVPVQLGKNVMKKFNSIFI